MAMVIVIVLAYFVQGLREDYRHLLPLHVLVVVRRHLVERLVTWMLVMVID